MVRYETAIVAAYLEKIMEFLFPGNLLYLTANSSVVLFNKIPSFEILQDVSEYAREEHGTWY